MIARFRRVPLLLLSTHCVNVAHARNQEVTDDVNRGHVPSRHVSIMTPVSECSDCSNDDDDEGGIVGGKSRSLRILPTTRSMVVDDGDRLSCSVAIGNDPSQYSVDMIKRFINDTTNQFISFERRKDSQTRSTSMSTMFPHSTPKYTLGEYKSQLPRAASQHQLPSATSFKTLPEALLKIQQGWTYQTNLSCHERQVNIDCLRQH